MALAIVMIVTANGPRTRSPASLSITEVKEAAVDSGMGSFATADQIMADLKKQADSIRRAAKVSDKGEEDAEIVSHLSDDVRANTN